MLASAMNETIKLEVIHNQVVVESDTRFLNIVHTYTNTHTSVSSSFRSV